MTTEALKIGAEAAPSALEKAPPRATTGSGRSPESVLSKPSPAGGKTGERDTDEESRKVRGKTWTLDDPELPEVFARMMRAVCPRCLEHRLDDLTQEGLLRLAKNGVDSHGERRVFNSTYLWTTATNLKREQMRKWQRRPTVTPVGEEEDGGQHELPDPFPDSDPARAAENGEIRRAIRTCLGKLARTRRRAVTLRLLGYSIAEIARFFEWSYRRAENLAWRGLANLRKCLALEGVTP